MNKLMLAVAVFALASCSASVEKSDTSAAVSTKSVMPKGIVHTDGHGPINLSVAGEAQCGSLSVSETRAALSYSNSVRAAAGLPALRTNAKLQKAAELQACDMASRGVMEHIGRQSTGPGMRIKQLGYKPQITAENIAAGASSIFDLNGAMREWAASARHRQNTNIPQMKEMGIGRALSPDGRYAYWSVVYSDPR
ncbi:CAP domain-containing protein [Paracoccus aestuariivivens]|uniref:CAP domain-containing protein n=1 Tax=Paracoccus aestuariivivens TaxID=1820333 RepID=A0A6L6JAL8_9RHOB|nr:CAP domain-containing protein [Paracoccus aestuariivivens]MTH77707.1 CAP domain-containing protein [Paracoccus aestuariivivens]